MHVFSHTLWVYICVCLSVFFTGIPHVVLMTHVDSCCPLVKEDLDKIYVSKKIKIAVSFVCVCCVFTLIT